SARLFGIVCVTDRPSKLPPQLGAVQDDLLRMYRLDCGEGYNKFASILHVNHKLGPPGRRNRSNCAELLTSISNKRLISYLDRFLHNSVLRNLLARGDFTWITLRQSSLL